MFVCFNYLIYYHLNLKFKVLMSNSDEKDNYEKSNHKVVNNFLNETNNDSLKLSYKANERNNNIENESKM